MAETPNHGYNVPDEGETEWHTPLNENFEQYDTDIEIRDAADSRSDYEPKEGAKFFATDTGGVFLGDGDNWVEVSSTGSSPTLFSLDVNEGINIPGGQTDPAVVYGETQSDGLSVAAVTRRDSGVHLLGPVNPDNQEQPVIPAVSMVRDGTDAKVGLGKRNPDVPLDINSQGNNDLTATDGDVRIGDDRYRLAIGVDESGAAARIRSKGGQEALYLGGGQSDILKIKRGDVTIEGDLDVRGNKNFTQTVETDDGEQEVVYTAREAGTPQTEASGVAQLSDGRATVELPDHFGWVTNESEPLVVQTTPYGGERGLKVVERSTDRIVVEDLDGEGDYEFAYTVTGTRAGKEDKQVVREPSVDAEDPNAPAPADD